MMRSMYSGVSGLRAHQSKMDTIGNNIANVNTVGFKSQRVTFQEVFNQTVRGASSSQDGKGGTNPQQVGLGVSISSIDTFHTRGAVQRTDNATDLAVNGDGFFILSDTADYLNRSYTRAGNFSLDESGNLVGANGYKVLGYMLDATTGNLKSSLEGVRISKAEQVPAKASSYATMEGNLDNQLTKIATVPTFTSGTTAADADTLAFASGDKYWETTSTVYDSLGGQHNLKMTFVRGMMDDGSLAVAGADSNWGVMIKDQDTGKYFKKDGIENTTGLTIADAVYGLKFDADGALIPADTTSTDGKLTLKMPSINGSDAFDLKVDFNKLVQFANSSTAAVTAKDGYKQGALDTFSIGPTGEINGIFTNGQNKVIGQLALAVFKNPAGLEKTTENMFSASPNSGEPIYGLPGASGMGSLNPGTLEMSNVDISREFAEMISTQRGFQANSRIITTSDEMLQELVNLKR